MKRCIRFDLIQMCSLYSKRYDEIICKQFIIYSHFVWIPQIKNMSSVGMFISFFLYFHFLFSFLLKQLLSVSHGMVCRTRNRICSYIHAWGNNSVRSTITINVDLSFKYASCKGYIKKLNGTNPDQFPFSWHTTELHFPVLLHLAWAMWLTPANGMWAGLVGSPLILSLGLPAGSTQKTQQRSLSPMEGGPRIEVVSWMTKWKRALPIPLLTTPHTCYAKCDANKK